MSIVDEISEMIGLSRMDASILVHTAPARYKTYTIPKKHGGERVIAHPSRELKAIQRFLLREKLADFPVHNSATGYVTGRSIAYNACLHKNSDILLKLDFQNFFPSILVKDWIHLCRSTEIGQRILPDVRSYAKLLFWSEKRRSVEPICLSIGAPSSPMLSNIVMFQIDTQLSALASDLNLVYSRYADDITVSGKELKDLLTFESRAIAVVRRVKSPRLDFNSSKRGIYTKGVRRMVTGIVITPTRDVSMGRARKRLISSLVHQARLGKLDKKQMAYLKGLFGFAISVEPLYVNRMREKYGDKIVDEILRFYVPVRSSYGEISQE